MTLFQLGDFTLASGAKSKFKIECDALCSKDWMALAAMAVEFLPSFGAVEGVPRGGLPFAEALRQYVTPGVRTLLVAEDVVTTGGSIDRYTRVMRDDPQNLSEHWLWGRQVGVCVFARGSCPDWITPLFRMPPKRT